MDHLLKECALHCGLSLSQYWHLRLVMSVSLGPLLAILYLILFDRRAPRQPPRSYSLWVRSDGQLVARGRP
ncbi:MAG: hypothetical protein ACRYFK_12255 [Janthinobacterium lividum]